MMQLNSDDIYRIKQTFPALEVNSKSFCEYFYDCLFEFSPILKPLFKSNRKVVEQHFFMLIKTCTSNIDNLQDFSETLAQLGKKHQGFQAKPEHFALIKSAFMLSLQYHLRDTLDRETEVAWGHYFDEISSSMQQGMTAY